MWKQYNNNLTMRDLFMNPNLAKIFPQFNDEDKMQGTQTFDWMKNKVIDFITNTFRTAEVSGNQITVVGNHSVVLREVERLKWVIEAFINNMPAVAKNLRKNTRLYMPYATVKQISEITTDKQKLEAFAAVLDNINFNPDFNSLDTIKAYASNLSFLKRQEAWQAMVGYMPPKNLKGW